MSLKSQDQYFPVYNVINCKDRIRYCLLSRAVNMFRTCLKSRAMKCTVYLYSFLSDTTTVLRINRDSVLLRATPFCLSRMSQ